MAPATPPPAGTSEIAPRHFLVVDLEATCSEDKSIPQTHFEIIEIGAVMVEADSLQPVNEFDAFVRPTWYPQLTAFCTQLTSITQQQVDAAETLPEVLPQFVRWAEQYPDYLFCSWGDFDRRHLRAECEARGLEYPFESGHLNLKRRFSERQRFPRRLGMARALRIAGLPLIGTHHRGIEDARNIARLLPFIVGTRVIA